MFTFLFLFSVMGATYLPSGEEADEDEEDLLPPTRKKSPSKSYPHNEKIALVTSELCAGFENDDIF